MNLMKEAFKSAPIAFIMKPIKVKEFEDTFLYMLQNSRNIMRIIVFTI